MSRREGPWINFSQAGLEEIEMVGLLLALGVVFVAIWLGIQMIRGRI